MNIIFDLDGTLFQTRLCIINAVKQLFLDNGWKHFDEEKVIHSIGKNSLEFLTAILPVGVRPNEVYEQFSFYERNEIQKSVQLFDGIEDLLSDLSGQGHKLYICSAGSDEYIHLVLEKTGIKEYFTKTISAKYISKNDAVEQLLDQNGFALIIGDTLSDFMAAKSNRIPSIGVDYGYGKPEDRIKATFIAQKAEDIHNYIKQIEIYHLLAQNIETENKRVVGINGVDTSGKSTFTNQFANFLISIGKEVEVLHIDDFHNPREIRLTGMDEIHAYYENAFHYKQVIEEILEPFQKEGSINKRVMCLNLDTDQYENEIQYKITPNTILLIEGVLLFRDPLNQYIDYKIYIHIGFDEVLRRAEIRDVPKYGVAFLEKYKNKYIPIQKMYLDEYDPFHKSDVVIHNEDYFCPYIVQGIGE